MFKKTILFIILSTPIFGFNQIHNSNYETVKGIMESKKDNIDLYASSFLISYLSDDEKNNLFDTIILSSKYIYQIEIIFKDKLIINSIDALNSDQIKKILVNHNCYIDYLGTELKNEKTIDYENH